MHCTVKMTEDLYWVGASDRRLALFESVYPIPRGVSYNAYVLLDEKTVLLDTVDQSVAGQFFENLAHVLGGRPLDYIVVHHMEPDHAKTLEETVRRYPEAKIICNAKIRDMIRNYFTFDIDARAILMAEGEKESAVLRADAKKQEQILEAQCRAEAILTVQRATAEGIRLINESMPSDAVIKLKSLEAFAAAADGRATKIIIPSEIQGAAALAAGLVESVKGEATNA